MDIWAIARSNDVEALKTMFAKGIGLRARDDKGMTLLHHAAEAGALNSLNYLIERGIELDTLDNAGFTPLHRAVMAKMEDAAIELIKHGANPRMLAKNGTSIMDLYPSLSPQFPERVKKAQQEGMQVSDRRESFVSTPKKDVHPVRFGDRILLLERTPSMSAPVSPVSRSDTSLSPTQLPMTPPPDLTFTNSPPLSPSSTSSSSPPSSPTKTLLSQSSSNSSTTPQRQTDQRRRATTVSKSHSTKDARSSIRDLISSSYSRRRNSTITAYAPLTKTSFSEVFNISIKTDTNTNTNTSTNTNTNAKTKTKSNKKKSETTRSPSASVSLDKRATTIGLTSPHSENSPKKSKSSHDTSKKSSKRSKKDDKQYGNEVVANVNIDDITEVLCKLIKVTHDPNFSQPQFEMRKLYDEVKLFSASLRQMFSASKKFASSLKDKTKANKILTVCKEIEENLVKELLEAIKKVTSNPTDTLALHVCLSRFIDEFWKLYTSCESTTIEDVVLALQTAVIWTRKLVKAAEGESTTQEESFDEISDVVASEIVQLTSLILEYSFANFKSPEVQQTLYESSHVVSQATRGLLLAAIAVRVSKDDRAQRTLTLLLKKIAEQVRVIALHIKPDSKNPSTQSQPLPSQSQLFDDGLKILSNAKDRYYVRSPDIPLMNEEKELLFIVAEQIEQIKNLKSAFLAEPRKKDTLLETVLSLTFSLTKITQIVHPICSLCTNSLLTDQLLLTLEALTRCSIQMKLLTCCAVHDDRSVCLNSRMLGYIVRGWCSYIAYLLEAVYKALH